MTPAIATAALNAAPDIAAVMPVAVFGSPMDGAAWDAFTEASGVPVVIDAAWSFDSAPRARSMTALSLHATKVLGVGEGGIILAPPNSSANLRSRSNFGFDGSREVHLAGRNGKLAEYASAVGLAALDRWPADREHVRTLARAYSEAFAKAGLLGLPGLDGSWATAAVAVDLGDADAERIRARLDEQDLETRRWWGQLVHEMPHFANRDCLEIPTALRLSKSVLNLPMSPLMHEADVDRVVRALLEAI
jgi:dTDP-4-amino-4,6-dideoxygalactose transaminase